MGKKKHKCCKSRCCCAEVKELTGLYEDLHRARCRAKQVRKSTEVPLFEFELNECERKWLEINGIPVIKQKISQQRQTLKGLMEALKGLNERLAKKEEQFCTIDHQIVELQCLLMDVQNNINEKVCRFRAQQEINQKQLASEEAVWRQKVKNELHEQQNLKDKIKALKCAMDKECLSRKACEDNRLNLRLDDTRLMLEAVKCIEKCLTECRSMCS